MFCLQAEARHASVSSDRRAQITGGAEWSAKPKQELQTEETDVKIGFGFAL